MLSHHKRIASILAVAIAIVLTGGGLAVGGAALSAPPNAKGAIGEQASLFADADGGESQGELGIGFYDFDILQDDSLQYGDTRTLAPVNAPEGAEYSFELEGQASSDSEGDGTGEGDGGEEDSDRPATLGWHVDESGRTIYSLRCIGVGDITLIMNVWMPAENEGEEPEVTTVTKTYTVAPKALVPTAMVQNKIYDGTDDAQGVVMLNGILPADAELVRVNLLNGKFDSPDVGDGKHTRFDTELIGVRASYYSCPSMLESNDGRIIAADASAFLVDIDTERVVPNGTPYANVLYTSPTVLITDPEDGTEVAAVPNASMKWFSDAAMTQEVQMSGTFRGAAGSLQTFYYKVQVPSAIAHNFINEKTGTMTVTLSDDAGQTGLSFALPNNLTYGDQLQLTIEGADQAAELSFVSMTPNATIEEGNRLVVTNVGGISVMAYSHLDGFADVELESSSVAGPRQLSITAKAADKSYDGTDAAAGSATVSGLVPSDSGVLVFELANGRFTGDGAENAGTNKPVVFDVSVDGAKMECYNYPTTVSSSASISRIAAKNLTNDLTNIDVLNGQKYSNLTNSSTLVYKTQSYTGAVSYFKDEALTVPVDPDEEFAGSYGETIELYYKILPDAAAQVNFEGEITGSITARIADGFKDQPDFSIHLSDRAPQYGDVVDIVPVGGVEGCKVEYEVLSSNAELVPRKNSVRITDLGDLVVKATASAEGYSPLSDTITVPISKRDLIVTVVARDKYYDGTNTAAGSIGLGGVVAGDDVSVSAIGRFDSAEVGEDREVVFLLAMDGKDKDYYNCIETVTSHASILKIKANSIDLGLEDEVVANGDKADFLADRVTVSVPAYGNVSGDVLWFSDADMQNRIDRSYVLEGEIGQVIPLYYKVVFEDSAAAYIDGEATGSIAVIINSDRVQPSLDVKAPAEMSYGDTVALSCSNNGEIISNVTYSIDSGNGVLDGNRIKAVGTGTVIVRATAHGEGIEGASAIATITVKKKQLTVTATAEDKVFDGTNAAIVAVSFDGVVPGDERDISFTVVDTRFDSANAGQAKTASARIVAQGAKSSFYDFPTAVTASADIFQADAAIMGCSLNDREMGRESTGADLAEQCTLQATFGTYPAGVEWYFDEAMGTDSRIGSSDQIFGAGDVSKVIYYKATVSGDDAGNFKGTRNGSITVTAAGAEQQPQIFLTFPSTMRYGEKAVASVSGASDGARIEISVSGAGVLHDDGVTVEAVRTGTVTVKATSHIDGMPDVSAEKVCTVEKRQLDLRIAANDKVFDGTTSAGGELSFAGVLDADKNDVIIRLANGRFEDVFAGASKKVVFDIVAEGAKVPYYEYPATVEAVAAITKAPASEITHSIENLELPQGATSSALPKTTEVYAPGIGTVQGEVKWYRDETHTQPIADGEIIGSGIGTVELFYEVVAPNSVTDNYEIAAGLHGSVTAGFKQGAQQRPVAITVGTRFSYGDETTVGVSGGVEGASIKIEVEGAAHIDAATNKITFTGVGAVVVKVTAHKDGYVDVSDTKTISVSKRELNATVTAKDKIYDGTDAAQVTVIISGAIEADGLSASATGRFADKNVGTRKAVSCSVQVLGKNSEFYTYPKVMDAVASITKAAADDIACDLGQGGINIDAGDTAAKLPTSTIGILGGNEMRSDVEWFFDAGCTKLVPKDHVFADGQHTIYYKLILPENEKDNIDGEKTGAVVVTAKPTSGNEGDGNGNGNANAGNENTGNNNDNSNDSNNNSGNTNSNQSGNSNNNESTGNSDGNVSEGGNDNAGDDQNENKADDDNNNSNSAVGETGDGQLAGNNPDILNRQDQLTSTGETGDMGGGNAFGSNSEANAGGSMSSTGDDIIMIAVAGMIVTAIIAIASGVVLWRRKSR